MEIFLIPETMIRYGKQEDLVQIDAFDKFGGEREQEIAARGLQVYVLGDVVVGYITAIKESCLCGYPLITFLCVHPQYRRRGIASALLSEIEQKYSDRKLFISTESNNLTMLNLIKKRRYKRSGSLSGLNDDGSDEIYFYK